MNYFEFRKASFVRAAEIEAAMGSTAVALYVRGGQGVHNRVFQILRLPREQYERVTRCGNADAKLGEYARRKGVAVGIHPNNWFDWVPVRWVSRDYMGCQVFAWPPK